MSLLAARVSSAISHVGSRLTSNMTQALMKHGIIPDVLDKLPPNLLNVKYANNVDVNAGNVLTPTQVKDEPNVQWDAESKDYYTLCMTDPDAPSRQDPKFREWHHWLIGNIPGNNLKKGDILSQYIGAGPPKDTGLHRYIFLLYKQKGKINFDEKRLNNRSGEDRGKFSIRNFANKYNLGNPLAINMFQAEYDDHVPKLFD